MGVESVYREIWERLAANSKSPERSRNLKVTSFAELSDKVLSGNKSFATELVESLYGGDVYILKGVLSKEYVRDLKASAYDLGLSSPPSFHQILEGVPNFHRIIEGDLSEKYYAKPIKHSYYFFPWNKESQVIFQEIRKFWRIFKLIGGLRADEFEGNTPKDGIIDRIQIVRYPRGGGKLDAHYDPFHSGWIVVSTYLSKRGDDYSEGGAYIVNTKDEIIDLESYIDMGEYEFSGCSSGAWSRAS